MLVDVGYLTILFKCLSPNLALAISAMAAQDVVTDIF